MLRAFKGVELRVYGAQSSGKVLKCKPLAPGVFGTVQYYADSAEFRHSRV